MLYIVKPVVSSQLFKKLVFGDSVPGAHFRHALFELSVQFFFRHVSEHQRCVFVQLNDLKRYATLYYSTCLRNIPMAFDIGIPKSGENDLRLFLYFWLDSRENI